MFLSLLGILQLHSVWTSTYSNFDETVNTEIYKLESTLDPSQQQLHIRDIKIDRTGGYYTAYILYEIVDREQKKP